MHISGSDDFRIQHLDVEGEIICTDAQVSDLIGNAWADDASMIVLPVGRLDPSFFDLRSGFAGALTQKLVNYRLRLVILGDVSAAVEASVVFGDWVRESNRGLQVWFLPDEAALEARLAQS